jgi:hypothetical protein
MMLLYKFNFSIKLVYLSKFGSFARLLQTSFQGNHLQRVQENLIAFLGERDA